VATTFDKTTQKVKLVCHRVFQPSPDDPLDFEETIEATLKELKSRFKMQRVLCDPWQLQAVMQRLQRAGIPIEEYPQTQSNLTAIGQGLFELVQARNLVLYPDAAMRLAVSRAVAVETSRGWRISKATASHKIDVVVALAMAAHAAVSKGDQQVTYSIVGVPTNGAQDTGAGRTFQDYLDAAKDREAAGVPNPTQDYETYQRAMAMRAGIRINGQPLEWDEIMRRIRAEKELLK
jgi:hypothetical protein